MNTVSKKYEISLTINGRVIIVKIQRPGLNYIDNYFDLYVLSIYNVSNFY